ncbi:hypothetical protein ACSVH2_00670 [Flavobacterium sp. RSB2_4_14]|uniref:hypothetical protein n=1 Tax=Flavobacterium sp. RSB2_4_14 TaxID=3447665 RepID=UPI003F3302DC
MNLQRLILLSSLFIFFFLSSCKTNRTINGKKEGKWVLIDTTNNDIYKHVEKYKKGEEVKTWKTFKNKKLYKIEKYRAVICHVTFFHENGKIGLEGNTKLETNAKEAHWFYFDEWKMYNESGKLIKLKYYESGVLISEIDVK